ncbi:MAG: ribulokinase [Planctomycetota bacterium]|nr:MAG: ribulokinase [Planctomycetota bacterium]
MDACALGLDFGTGSVRAVVVRVTDGRLLGAAVEPYTRGDGGVITRPSEPHLARQDPADLMACLERCALKALAAAERSDRAFRRDRVRGIGVDTTGSTPLPVDESLQSLALDPAFRDDPAALAWLWKDHTAAAEAAEITAAVRAAGRPWLTRCGGVYSPEWYWAKLLRAARTSPAVTEAAAGWLELCDWIPAVLCGVDEPAEVRIGVCAAGHKGMFAADWGGWPEAGFLASLHPRLADWRRSLPAAVSSAGQAAGLLAPSWQSRFGLEAVPVSVGALDAHLGAVGAGVRPGRLVKILGTSTCDLSVGGERPVPAGIPGIAGVVEGSVLPGRTGIEAGQAAVGDLFAWWSRLLGGTDLDRLGEEAARLRPGESGLLALDWNNGNRNILADPELTGLLLGQTLATGPVEVFRALVEATAFGARTILERLEEHAVPVRELVAAGGIAGRSAFLLQVYADVLGRPIAVAASPEACALGAAICGAAAAGLGGVEELAAAMVPPPAREFAPNPAAAAVYERLYALYRRLHDHFGGVAAVDLSTVMKELLALRREAAGAA